MIDETGTLRTLIERQLDMLGNATHGRAVTATLRVSPNGSGADGLSWRTAYTTIQDALDAASTDTDDCTLILISPHTTYYDINITGDPTWAASVVLMGTHPHGARVRNDHASATSVMKLTGKSSVENLLFDLGTGNHGLILTRDGVSVDHVHFDGTSLTSGKTCLWLDGDSSEHADIVEVEIFGNTTNTTGFLVDQFGSCHIDRILISACLVGIQIVGANSDENEFHRLDIGDCVTGLDIDAGSEQHFDNLHFHHNTRDVDDEVGDHVWINVRGRFDIDIFPDNFTGITVSTGGAGVYGVDTEILSAAGRDNPFRIVGTHVEPSTSEWYRLRFSDDSGSTFFDVLQFDGAKREGIAAPSGTEHIFNAGTRISGSAKDVSGGDNVKVWLEIQEV